MVVWKSIEDMGSFFGGLTGKTKEDFQKGNAKFITYMNVFANSSLDINTTGVVKINQGEKQNKIQKGDILFSGSSETPEEAGMSCVVTDDLEEDYYMNSFCFGLRLNNPEQYNLHYLKHILRSYNIRQAISKTASGVTRFNISKARFGKVQIPIPSLSEQNRIVGILNTFTDSIENLKQQIAQRRKQYEHYREILLDLEGKEGVEMKMLGDIGGICMCKRIMKNQTSEKGDVPFFKIGTFGGCPDAYISRSLFEDYKTKYSYPKKGDILISAAGTIGRSVVFDGNDAYYQDSNIVWIDNDEKLVNNVYLRFFYQVAKWKTDGGTVKRLYNYNLINTPIPVPSLIEQNRIVSILDTFEASISNLEAQLEQRQKQYEYYRNKLLSFEKEEH